MMVVIPVMISKITNNRPRYKYIYNSKNLTTTHISMKIKIKIYLQIKEKLGEINMSLRFFGRNSRNWHFLKKLACCSIISVR